MKRLLDAAWGAGYDLAEGFLAGLAVLGPFLALGAVLAALVGFVYGLAWAASAGWHAG